VRDNGSGITSRDLSNTRSLGILGMRERALLVDGIVEIEGVPGKGTTVSVRVPLIEASSTRTNNRGCTPHENNFYGAKGETV
jgi:nitrate/nitrite-specific signal transduction histidine kinase